MILLCFKKYRYLTSSFNRPGFTALLEEIEAGRVDTLVVKDLSRFGRNYLQVGYYTEIVFPKKGVRFIAINNNVDSANPTENDFTPFLNIMNEWYAKDTSNKIKAVFKSRMKEGLRCSGAIPYGYKRINGDKQTLVVDEPAAEIVRKVFRLACHGMGVTAIAEQLTEEKVLIPSAYTAKYFPENCRNRSFSDPYRWNANTIGHILDRQEYLGHTVLGKSICENFKTKQRRAATPEELMIFPDTHEAIIDQDTWDIAQKLRVRAKPRAATGTCRFHLENSRCFFYFRRKCLLNLFEAVKQNVTTRQAAERYGIRIRRNGMAVCPFHNDKNPSMKLDRRFHCFGCQADGDAVDFVSRLFGLPSKEAAMKIADDFGISYDSRQKPSIRPKIREPTPEQKYQQEENHCYKVLSDYFHLLRKWEKQYAPQRTDEVWHPLFVEALEKKSYIEYLLDILLYDTPEEKKALVAEQRKEVMKLEQRIAGHTAEHDRGRSQRKSGLDR